jgi:hypothetical protein
LAIPAEIRKHAYQTFTNEVPQRSWILDNLVKKQFALYTPYDPNLLRLFWKFTRKLDALRDESFTQANPEFFEMLRPYLNDLPEFIHLEKPVACNV